MAFNAVLCLVVVCGVINLLHAFPRQEEVSILAYVILTPTLSLAYLGRIVNIQLFL